MKIGKCLRDRDWSKLAEMIRDRFGCSIDLKELSKLCGHPKKWPTDEDHDTLAWLKIRILDRLHEGQRVDQEIGFKTELHVFFLFLEETPEMIERLQAAEPETKDCVARSKIFETQLIPSPIDRVAIRCSDARMRREKRDEYQRMRERRRSGAPEAS